jgi:segregation and condensation protein B
LNEQKSPPSSKVFEKKESINLIEAALYVAGRPLDLKTLGSIIKTRSKKKAQRYVKALAKKYDECNGALELLQLEDQRFVLQLKMEYTSNVRKLAIRPLLTRGPLKTLSYIAYRQPVLQTQVIEVRGTHAYKHLRQLEDLDLIVRQNAKRTKLIRTTEFFADYFGLSHSLQTMKRQLKSIFEEFSMPTHK